MLDSYSESQQGLSCFCEGAVWKRPRQKSSGHDLYSQGSEHVLAAGCYFRPVPWRPVAVDFYGLLPSIGAQIPDDHDAIDGPDKWDGPLYGFLSAAESILRIREPKQLLRISKTHLDEPALGKVPKQLRRVRI